MSNELSLFNQKVSYDLSYMDKIDDNLTKQLAGAVAGKRISIRGGVFRMMVSGQEVAKSPDRHLNVVIVDAAPNVSRTYYKGTYQEGVMTAPTCWSDDGVKPDTNCATKMSNTCMDCPMNVKGSGLNDSRACRYSKRLSVVLANDIKGDIYGLTLAATSLFGKGDDNAMPLQQYSRKLAGHNFPIRAVVTRIQFDLDSATPKLIFSAERPLNQNEFDIITEQSQTEESKAAIASINYASMVKDKDEVKSAPVEVKAPKAPKPAASSPFRSEQFDSDEVEAPVVREKKTNKPEAKVNDLESILADWDSDD